MCSPCAQHRRKYRRASLQPRPSQPGRVRHHCAWSCNVFAVPHVPSIPGVDSLPTLLLAGEPQPAMHAGVRRAGGPCATNHVSPPVASVSAFAFTIHRHHPPPLPTTTAALRHGHHSRPRHLSPTPPPTSRPRPTPATALIPTRCRRLRPRHLAPPPLRSLPPSSPVYPRRPRPRGHAPAITPPSPSLPHTKETKPGGFPPRMLCAEGTRGALLRSCYSFSPAELPLYFCVRWGLGGAF